jgi:DNA polymerase-3 subunit alpha
MIFAHLHVHNEYSVLDGVGTSKQYAAMAKELGQEWLCLSNHSNIDGAIEHQKQCLDTGIKPIIGAEMYLVDDLYVKNKGETRYHITLLVENQTGWRNLLKLLTIANIDGFYYRPRIDHQTLLNHIEGLVVLSACSMSFIKKDNGADMLRDYIEAIGKDRAFLEVMPHQIPEQIETNKLVLSLSKKLGLQIVATNDIHYPTSEATKHQEVLLAIQTKKKWLDKDRWKFNCGGLFLKSEQQMFEAFQEQGCLTDQQIKRAIRRTVTVAKLCENFRIEKQEVYLPSIKNFPSEQDEITFLENRIHRGLRLRLKDKTFDELVPYRERIDMEMKLIIAKKFTRYFLIVWDLIKWCEKEGIMTGPGRGSVGGSLIAYLLFITDCDPLVYGTEFFRFVDESRCFTGETKVLINNEVKNISKVKVGDTVINKYGEKDVVKNIRKFNIKEKVLKIYFEDNFIVCTQDHKWIVMDKHNNIIEKMAKDLDVKNDNLIRIK